MPQQLLAAATCSVLHVPLSAAASTFYFLCSISSGAAACHINNDSGSGTAVSSAAGAGAAVATRIVHFRSIVHTSMLSMVMFPSISCGSLFVRSISPNNVEFFVIPHHSKSGSSLFNSNLSLSPQRITGNTFIYVRLHFLSPNPEKK